MKTGITLTAFAVTAAATFGVAYGVGAGIDPIASGNASAAHRSGHAPPSQPGGGHHDGRGAHPDGHARPQAERPGGLEISGGGYTLDLRTPRLQAGVDGSLRFAVLDTRTGEPLRDYRTEHGKRLHLIVASRDLTTYRHLHPELSAEGIWQTGLDLPEAGGYRVFADFTPAVEGAQSLTLGADLAVAGDYEPRPLPEPSRTATVDGYTVTLEGGLAADRQAELDFTVEKNGREVTDLQPYLGAYGHLVALRVGDLAYLHVHPEGGPGDGETPPGPRISFAATAPTSASYRLFLDFRHGGEVRTAAFTVRAATGGSGEPERGSAGGAEPGHGSGSGSGEHAH